MAKGKNFEQLGCQVVVVDSGTRESGLEWLHERGYPFPLLIDRDRVFYHQLGLRRFLKDSACQFFPLICRQLYCWYILPDYKSYSRQ